MLNGTKFKVSNIDHFCIDNDISSECNFENCRDGCSASLDTHASFVPAATQ